MEYNRLVWASRRGMLELDLILQPFIENVYKNLDVIDQKSFDMLLEEQDQDLFNWFLKKEEPENENLLRIVKIVREKSNKYANKTK
ncbi:MAG: antitoxin CptB [Colwellia sp.]|jgi:antitoxin CptB